MVGQGVVGRIWGVSRQELPGERQRMGDFEGASAPYSFLPSIPSFLLRHFFSEGRQLVVTVLAVERQLSVTLASFDKFLNRELLGKLKSYEKRGQLISVVV